MGIGSKLSKLMDMNGTNANELARKIGVSPQTIYSIIKRDSKKADIEVLLKLADTLGVTAEYFVDDINTGNESGLEQYSKEELNHLKKYHDLDPIGQPHVDAVLQWETERVKQIEQAASTPAATRMINYYYKLASAGTGQIVFDMPPTKRIEIPAIPEYRKADYAIGVNGNSMEPVYHDGDTLLVEMTDHVEIGEIGIFLVNGESFVKKLGETELISLNLGSKNIPLNENARCLGRVIDKLTLDT